MISGGDSVGVGIAATEIRNIIAEEIQEFAVETFGILVAAAQERRDSGSSANSIQPSYAPFFEAFDRISRRRTRNLSSTKN